MLLVPGLLELALLVCAHRWAASGDEGRVWKYKLAWSGFLLGTALNPRDPARAFGAGLVGQRRGRVCLPLGPFTQVRW